MRFVGIVLALAVGLATAGPEMHQCPVHDQHESASSSASHHQTQPADHHSEPESEPGPGPRHNCTCPQACCPIGVGVALPATNAELSIAAAPPVRTSGATVRRILPGAPKHLLPFSLAPPHTLV